MCIIKAYVFENKKNWLTESCFASCFNTSEISAAIITATDYNTTDGCKNDLLKALQYTLAHHIAFLF